MSGSLVEKREVFDFLERRKAFLDGVVISGGEPTLQEDLVLFCKRLKKMEYPVKLDTNGSRPQTIKKLIDEGLIDYIAMDIKSDPFDYSPLIKRHVNSDHLLESIRIIMESGLAYEFRTTCVRPIVDGTVVRKISKQIRGAMLYALQRFHNADVLHPEFFCENETEFDEGGLLDLKSIAEPWVQRCIVRL